MKRILENLKDTSLAANPKGNGSMQKQQKYGWSGPGEKGQFIWIDKQLLKIDLSYQRELNSKSRILRIASEFRWTLFGALMVVKNADGYYVTDGGHRLRATLLRGDIEKVPCMVYSSESIKEEADLFVKLNTLPKGVNPFDRHKAGLVAGHPVAVNAQRIIQKHGYNFSAAPRDFEIAAVHTVHTIVSRNVEVADKTIGILCEIAGGKIFHIFAIGGLYYLLAYNQHIDFRTFPLANMMRAGIEKMENDVNRIRIFKGKGGEKICAEGLLEIINHGQRENKVRIPV